MCVYMIFFSRKADVASHPSMTRRLWFIALAPRATTSTDDYGNYGCYQVIRWSRDPEPNVAAIWCSAKDSLSFAHRALASRDNSLVEHEKPDVANRRAEERREIYRPVLKIWKAEKFIYGVCMRTKSISGKYNRCAWDSSCVCNASNFSSPARENVEQPIKVVVIKMMYVTPIIFKCSLDMFGDANLWKNYVKLDNIRVHDEI